MILCAVDDSAAAERVVDTGRWLAEGLQTPLVVVHVSEDPDGADEVVGRVRARLNGGDADVRVLPGSPAEAIREAVDEHDPELVVVGSRGHGPLRSTLTGSVSRDLASTSRSPVVVVPSGENWAADAGDGGAEPTSCAGSTGRRSAGRGQVCPPPGHTTRVPAGGGSRPAERALGPLLSGSSLRDAARDRPGGRGPAAGRRGHPASLRSDRRQRGDRRRVGPARRGARVGGRP